MTVEKTTETVVKFVQSTTYSCTIQGFLSISVHFAKKLRICFQVSGSTFEKLVSETQQRKRRQI